MQVRKLDRNVYDVFLYAGHDNWSRIRKFHWGIKVIDGVRLNRDEAQAVEQAIATHPNGSVENV